jgi:hypothetical protein
VAQDAIPYYQAARFKDKKTAGAIYIVVQELIYQDIDCDLSAYRIKLNNVWHVIVIGAKPSERLHVEIEAQLTNGVLVTVDSDTLHFLMRRRGQATKLGPWIEVHYSHDEEE